MILPDPLKGEGTEGGGRERGEEGRRGCVMAGWKPLNIKNNKSRKHYLANRLANVKHQTTNKAVKTRYMGLCSKAALSALLAVVAYTVVCLCPSFFSVWRSA